MHKNAKLRWLIRWFAVLSSQLSIEVISKMLGYSSINMTKKYARVVDDLINKNMKKIYGKFDDIRVS